MKKRPTMRDVSEAANVSMFTVSRAITTGEGVSAATRAHVRSIAAELGYVPNQFARTLRGGSTRTVGILAANTLNPYYSTLVASIEHVLRERGYHGLVMDAVLDGEYQTDRENAFVDDLLQQQVAAVLLTYSISSENASRLREQGVELMFVDSEPPPGFEDLSSVTPDNYSGSRAIGDHIAAHGYAGPWAFIGFPQNYGARSPRQAGFTDAAHAAGAEVELIESRNDAESSYLATSAYLDARPTPPRVIFATNELLFQGMLRSTRERGLRVPDDIAVVAYDEFAWASLLDPAVTVVDQHVSTIGTVAATALLAALDGRPAAAGRRTQIRSELIVRRSCGCTLTPEN